MRNTKKRSKNSKKSKTSKKNKPKNRLYKGGTGEKEFREHMNYVIEKTKKPFTKPKSKETQNTGFNPVYNFNNQTIDENIKTIDTIFVDLVYYINNELKENKINIDRLKKILDEGLINTKFNPVLNGDFGIHKLVLKIYTYYNYDYLLSITKKLENEYGNYTLVDDVIHDVLYKYNKAIAEYNKITDDSRKEKLDMSIIPNVYKDIAKIVYDYYKNPNKKSRFNTTIENPTSENINMISYLQNPHIDIDMMEQLNDVRAIAPTTTPSMQIYSNNKANTLERRLQELRNEEDNTYTDSDTIIPKAPEYDPRSKGPTPPPKPPRTGIYSLKRSPKK
jgi:hypothetical protein